MVHSFTSTQSEFISEVYKTLLNIIKESNEDKKDEKDVIINFGSGTINHNSANSVISNTVAEPV